MQASVHIGVYVNFKTPGFVFMWLALMKERKEFSHTYLRYMCGTSYHVETFPHSLHVSTIFHSIHILGNSSTTHITILT